jgi:hypothetical protein
MAPGGRGKSSLVLVEAVAMATGRALLGDEPLRRLKVWYHNGEENWEEPEAKEMRVNETFLTEAMNRLIGRRRLQVIDTPKVHELVLLETEGEKL